MLYTDIVQLPTPSQVTTIGTGPNDGWSVVARLPSSRLPAANSGYSFLVIGKFGRFSYSGGPPNNGIVQIRIGDTAGTKHPGFVAQAYLTDPTIDELSQPFCFLVHVNSQVADALWGATWNGSFDLCVYARIYTNGDPLNYAGSFEVSDVAVQWWHVAAIPSGKWQAGAESVAGLTMAASASYNTRIAGAAFGAAGQRWMCQHSFSYISNNQIVPKFAFGFTLNSSTAEFTAKVGAYDERWGASGRGPLFSILERPTHSWPAMWQHVLTDSTARVSWRGRDPLGATSPRTEILRHNWLAVRIDELYAVAAVESPLRVDMLTDNSTESGLYPFEPALPGHITPVVLFYCTQIPETPVSFTRNSWQIRLNDGRPVWTSRLALDGRANREGIPDIAVSRNGLLPGPWAVRYEAFQHTQPGIARNRADHAADVLGLQFHPDTSPSDVPDVPPTASAPVVVVPGRESLDVGSLLDLPIDPDGSYTESPTPIANSEVHGDTGYRRTWPVLLRPHRVLSVQWSGISKTQRDTLLAFLRGNAFFRWQPIGTTTKQAFAAATRPEVETVDNVSFTVRAQIVRLIYVGI